MKTIHKEFSLTKISPILSEYFNESSLFFDIETTGFSPKNAQLYLIGCIKRKGTLLLVDQFFAENLLDEPKVLDAFLQLLTPDMQLICFHGIGFDLPFLNEKIQQFHMDFSLSTMNCLDLFKQMYPYKKILGLENRTQRTYEDYLQTNRLDSFTGGELISVYKEYCKHPSAEVLELLLQHNLDDLTGMVTLLPLMAYPCLFQGKYEISSLKRNDYTSQQGTSAKEVFFSLTPKFSLPHKISYLKDDFYLSGTESTLTLRAQIHCTQLKFFYNNYKDYYYLPMEDLVIHKSVGSYVSKEFREKATSENCFIRKDGEFLGQPQQLFSPSFCYERKDRMHYFELNTAFLKDSALQKKYCDLILSYLLR
ncbi:MAG: ribonuclease H-like domain-containing protein [Lachnospiraceae bacterium]